MLYTVKEVAKFTGVTVKALHHYHKIRLLFPHEVNEAGYRLYGEKELERLQQILFYRELDFSLSDIKKALEDEPNRLECLVKQQELLIARKQRTDRLLKTINESIVLGKRGEIMDKSAMFKGFNKEEWKYALSNQKNYLKGKYGYDMPEVDEAQVNNMNEAAMEAQQFMNYIKDALKNGVKANDTSVQETLKNHIQFLNDHGHRVDAKSFVSQTKFFLDDDFHRSMLENQLTGLSYYLYTAAEMYASLNQ
ncbi:MerR family transcriptional regulator [Clostridium beijerinckii]|uniref:MerR family transcriptional regulator n=1 Tax=Clostridium beijerinckii TaxID=1520 RepID=A0AB74VBF8_CLOBE|nr:MerR family transcriptional regulator [Clostridium beijerinckii]NOW90336.1 DNA-binding transcriptional MerR regulator [Clostridium beijerinckii]NRZ27985.1 DNA-binding transcriptional MerR regulator [Clostridium beijerinckii]NYB96238.1 DNA-binding transcriptional MerR regulator [Clostridium beijerinckii]OOM20556.1 HTH-type transcriptional activator mta [Clostridium beijerinckii]QUN33740.1 MerR family transcriptional regulator [Clostridium beijerinckii]